MKFTNETQFINDAASEIIKVHLNWSNSLDSKPSDNCATEVYGKIEEAYMTDKFGKFWDDDITPEIYRENQPAIKKYYEMAVEAADKKWEQIIAMI